MSAAFDVYRPRHDGVTIPTIAIWIVLSLLVHLALLLWTPPPRKPRDEFAPPPLTAYLRPAPQAESPPPVQAEIPPEPQTASPTERVPLRPVKPPAPPPPPSAPAPVVVLSKPTVADQPSVFTAPTPPNPPRAEPPPLAQIPQLTTPPPAETDFSAALEAKRRARGEAATDTPAADAAHVNRGALASAPLKSSPPITFESKKPSHHGGLFQIRRRGFDYAEFMFYGWNENFRRDALQLIEVRKGNNSDIDIAVVRAIIEIIRKYEREDFSWYSKRIGKSLTLSARARDNGNLEEFMMQEFQEDLHRYR